MAIVEHAGAKSIAQSSLGSDARARVIVSSSSTSSAAVVVASYTAVDKVEDKDKINLAQAALPR